jgi:meckelin
MAAAHGRQQFNTLSASKSASGLSKPSSAQLSSSVQAYHSMNRFLTAFLEHALSDMDYEVTKKSFFESTFDMEFGEVGNDRAIFYTGT